MKFNLDHKDKNALTFAFVCALFVSFVIVLLAVAGLVSYAWLLLPGSWLIGALMTWAVGKFSRNDPPLIKTI